MTHAHRRHAAMDTELAEAMARDRPAKSEAGRWRKGNDSPARAQSDAVQDRERVAAELAADRHYQDALARSGGRFRDVDPDVRRAGDGDAPAYRGGDHSRRAALMGPGHGDDGCSIEQPFQPIGKARESEGLPIDGPSPGSGGQPCSIEQGSQPIGQARKKARVDQVSHPSPAAALLPSRLRLKDMRTMHTTSTKRVLLTTLSARTSSKGNEYLSGYLAKARVVAFKGQPDRFGHETWNVYVVEPEPKPGMATDDRREQHERTSAEVTRGGVDADWDQPW